MYHTESTPARPEQNIIMPRISNWISLETIIIIITYILVFCKSNHDPIRMHNTFEEKWLNRKINSKCGRFFYVSPRTHIHTYTISGIIGAPVKMHTRTSQTAATMEGKQIQLLGVVDLQAACNGTKNVVAKINWNWTQVQRRRCEDGDGDDDDEKTAETDIQTLPYLYIVCGINAKFHTRLPFVCAQASAYTALNASYFAEMNAGAVWQTVDLDTLSMQTFFFLFCLNGIKAQKQKLRIKPKNDIIGTGRSCVHCAAADNTKQTYQSSSSSLSSSSGVQPTKNIFTRVMSSFVFGVFSMTALGVLCVSECERVRGSRFILSVLSVPSIPCSIFRRTNSNRVWNAVVHASAKCDI